jgi:hypothetical protein
MLSLEQLEPRLVPTIGSFAIGEAAEFIPAARGCVVAITDLNNDGVAEIWQSRRGSGVWHGYTAGQATGVVRLGPAGRDLLDMLSTLQAENALAREQAAALGVTVAAGSNRPIFFSEWLAAADALSHVPAGVRAYVAANTRGLQLIAAPGVTADPDYAFLHGTRALDGRPFDTITGAAEPGLPAVVAAPNCDLPFALLHEFGHLVDLARAPAFSSQPAWTSLHAGDLEDWADGFANVLLGRPVSPAVASYFASFLTQFQ